MTLPSDGGSVVNAMTIDVEDYFQVSAFDSVVSRDQWDRLESRVCRNTQKLLNIFRGRGVKATFFILGWVAERYPSLVAEIVADGHEVASHGYEHRLVYTQSPQAFREDIRRAKRVIEAAAGQHVAGYRAPSYSITRASLWALDILLEEGHSYDASIFPIRHDRYGIPDAPRHPHVMVRDAGHLTEVPGSTVRIAAANLPVAGGGYFRILPYRWTQWGIGRLNRLERTAAVFYLHPWEVDPDQPRLKVGTMTSWRHYTNLDKTERRLQRLLDDFSFCPLRTILERTPAAA